MVVIGILALVRFRPANIAIIILIVVFACRYAFSTIRTIMRAFRRLVRAYGSSANITSVISIFVHTIGYFFTANIAVMVVIVVRAITYLFATGIAVMVVVIVRALT